ncbi:MAG: hypothetical protein ACRD36_12460, partial [Candidatus Acidiferrum sp.]
MTQTIDCPQCNRQLHVTDDLQGTSVKCPACNVVFHAPTASEMRTPQPAKPPVLTVHDEDHPQRMHSQADTPFAEASAQRGGEKTCVECGATIRAKAVICPKCGVGQPGTPMAGQESDSFANNKIAAGICGILVGSLGIH